MATTADFRNGLVINHKGNLWKIVEFLHVKPGKGAAFVRTKLKNIRTGQVIDETFRASERVEEVRVEARSVTYLYHDGDLYHFMDSETYEQFPLSSDQVGDAADFLIENLELSIAFHQQEPVEIRVPQHMNLKIIKTEPGVRGDTATGGTKPATLETGVVVQVPLFINEGETVRVDTREHRYIERVRG